MGHRGGCDSRVEDAVDRALLRALTFQKKKKEIALLGTCSALQTCQIHHQTLAYLAELEEMLK